MFNTATGGVPWIFLAPFFRGYAAFFFKILTDKEPKIDEVTWFSDVYWTVMKYSYLWEFMGVVWCQPFRITEQSSLCALHQHEIIIPTGINRRIRRDVSFFNSGDLESSRVMQPLTVFTGRLFSSAFMVSSDALIRRNKLLAFHVDGGSQSFRSW